MTRQSGSSRHSRSAGASTVGPDGTPPRPGSAATWDGEECHTKTPTSAASISGPTASDIGSSGGPSDPTTIDPDTRTSAPASTARRGRSPSRMSAGSSRLAGAITAAALSSSASITSSGSTSAGRTRPTTSSRAATRATPRSGVAIDQDAGPASAIPARGAAHRKASTFRAGSARRATGLPIESEKHFMAAIVQLARALGWKVHHTFDSRRSEPGVPDLLLAKMGRPVVFLECKREGGQLTAAQASWLQTLRGCPGVVAHAVWPSEWDAIVRILNGETV